MHRVWLRAIVWVGDKAHPPPPTPCFVFDKHKTWKWLRRWSLLRTIVWGGGEWVSRKHIWWGLLVQPACWHLSVRGSSWVWVGGRKGCRSFTPTIYGAQAGHYSSSPLPCRALHRRGTVPLLGPLAGSQGGRAQLQCHLILPSQHPCVIRAVCYCARGSQGS